MASMMNHDVSIGVVTICKRQNSDKINDYTVYCSIRPGSTTKICFVIRYNEKNRLLLNKNPNGI